MNKDAFVAGYDSKENIEIRAEFLYEYGHNSNVWDQNMNPHNKGYVIEILAPYYVSRPCWEEIIEASDHMDTAVIDFRMLVEFAEDAEQETVYQFFFSDFEIAKKMVLRVQNSARNKRKDLMRHIRLDKAGGFHNIKVLDRLFEIQQGRCYYSGKRLIRQPKNFVVDHIIPIYLGGTDWPGNLALVIKEINTWKGGHASAEDTLQWLAKKYGKDWLSEQKTYCHEVDRKRENLDLKFRHQHEAT